MYEDSYLFLWKFKSNGITFLGVHCVLNKKEKYSRNINIFAHGYVCMYCNSQKIDKFSYFIWTTEWMNVKWKGN